MVSIFSRFFSPNRRQPIPSTDSAGDVEAQAANASDNRDASLELSASPGTRPGMASARIEDETAPRNDGASDGQGTSHGSEEPGRTTTGSEAAGESASGASNGPSTNADALGDMVLEAIVNSRLTLIRRTSQFLLMLTILQIMSTLATEHIHFLSLFSLFVPWTGFEGAKERNFAYLRAYYWGCWVMIPANFFHYLSFEQLMQEVMATTTIDENLKKELVFNHQLFNGVTVVIVIGMIFSLIWVRQLSMTMRSMRQYLEHELEHASSRREPRVPSGPLSQEEMAAIVAFKISPADIDTEAAEKDVCVICQDEFQLNELAKRLNCRHMFHAHCIDAWLQRSCLCPICNGEVRTIV